MPRRSSIDALVEGVLSELEAEFEAEVSGKAPPGTAGVAPQKKFSYKWRVSLKEFGSVGNLVEDLSTGEEVRTPDDALFRHSAVVMMAFKTLMARGFAGQALQVERWVYDGGWQRDRRWLPNGREDSGCSSVLLNQPLRINDCSIANR
jgi:hypothetical protein